MTYKAADSKAFRCTPFSPTVYLVALSLLIAITTTSTAGILVMGKYHRPTLAAQNLFCHGNVCDECMSDYWPNLLNIFDTENGPNCNGVFPPPFVSTNRIGIWGKGDWAWFWIIGSEATLQQTVDYCKQNFYETNCYFNGAAGPDSMPGAYHLGDEYGLIELDNLIDRAEIGWPQEIDFTPFQPLRPYVEDAVIDLGYDNSYGWRAIFTGAARYVAELELGGSRSRI